MQLYLSSIFLRQCSLICLQVLAVWVRCYPPISCSQHLWATSICLGTPAAWLLKRLRYILLCVCLTCMSNVVDWRHDFTYKNAHMNASTIHIQRMWRHPGTVPFWLGWLGSLLLRAWKMKESRGAYKILIVNLCCSFSSGSCPELTLCLIWTSVIPTAHWTRSVRICTVLSVPPDFTWNTLSSGRKEVDMIFIMWSGFRCSSCWNYLILSKLYKHSTGSCHVHWALGCLCRCSFLSPTHVIRITCRWRTQWLLFWRHWQHN